MWVMTTQGFYSAVAYRGRDDVMLIRARAKRDLLNLDRQIPGVKKGIYKDEGADYLWRVVVSREEWALALARLSHEVDYDNFKSAVAKGSGGRARESIYHRVWSALTHIEPGFASRYYGRWSGGDEGRRLTAAERLFDDEEGVEIVARLQTQLDAGEHDRETLYDKYTHRYGPDPSKWPAWDCKGDGQQRHEGRVLCQRNNGSQLECGRCERPRPNPPKKRAKRGPKKAKR